MSGRLTRSAYERLIEEDIAVLMQSPRTLERDHIKQVLLASAGHEYPDESGCCNEAAQLREMREAAEQIALILLETLYLYPNYRVDNRGPTGEIVDAIELASPDIGSRLRKGEDPGDLLKELESESRKSPEPPQTQASAQVDEQVSVEMCKCGHPQKEHADPNRYRHNECSHCECAEYHGKKLEPKETQVPAQKVGEQVTVFERIVAGEIPANKVYEDEVVLAFHDANPQAPVHVVIVPKHKIVGLASASNIDAIVLGFMLLAASKVAEVLGVAKSGFRLVWNVGEHAGQTVAYLHCHLLAGKPLGGILPTENKGGRDSRERNTLSDPPPEGHWVHSWIELVSGAHVLEPIRFRYSPEGVRLWFNHSGVLVTEPGVWIPIVEACECGHTQEAHGFINKSGQTECCWCVCSNYQNKLWESAPNWDEEAQTP